ncbi:unnamed protein product [Chondrus crispus]|uniref:Trafficking protein particle complex subunit n=1 Tax=Chondrus crispus TaxID=2769 RepID=R7QIL7_CHOCR|nr:unnamed protein product [Chondrus crispus]CDF37914.1 unnamed protein product [Chondrus crispus]|eukprot:XP_005717785.1 unnamed protein product [Chondrus crispus]
MLHSFMIISGRGGLVLYRKVFTRAPNQPRLIAGLVTALGEFSVRSIGIPITHIELENVTITALEIPIGNDEAGSEHLRAVLFHDTGDADLYGHSVGLQLLTVFKENYAERLLSLQLANVQGVEDIFKGFGALVRPAIVASVFPLLEFRT